MAIKNLQWVGVVAFVVIQFLSSTQASKAADQPPPDGPNHVAADNSGQNKEVKGKESLTADNQSNSAADIKITKEIRQSIEHDHNLSVLAKNVKIITVNGSVTLRGPVNTTEEKNNINQIAKRVAGENSVDNQLEVKSNRVY